jgi:cyclic beta-1,2-glucan synthetase
LPDSLELSRDSRGGQPFWTLTGMALEILRRLIGARLPTDFTEFEEPIRAELFSAERLEQHAQSLAVAQTVTEHPEDKRALVSRVLENGRVLHEAHKIIGDAVRQHLAITPAAEWLLDNFHVVEDQLRDIREHLPASYYKKLPKLADGHLRGYPRVYGVAWALVAHADSRFDPDLLIRFIRAYQRVQPLTLGELWAVPISLRIVMVENLRRLAVSIAGSQMARQVADKFVDELLPDMETPPSDLVERAIRTLGSPALWPAFAVQLVQRLRYRAAGTTALLEWLNRVPATKDASIDEIVQAQHAGQGAANLTVRNLITSMRAIAAFDWRSFVEEVSLVDAALRQNPGFVAMDFKTRDRYRHAIEELAEGASRSEVEVAAAVIAKIQQIQTGGRGSLAQWWDAGGLTESGLDPDPRLQEPGFYLIAAGREELERELGYRKSLRERCVSACLAHAPAVYLGAILLLTLAVATAPVVASIEAGMTWSGLLTLGLLSLLPASDMAIALSHHRPEHLRAPPLASTGSQRRHPGVAADFRRDPDDAGERGRDCRARGASRNTLSVESRRRCVLCAADGLA